MNYRNQDMDFVKKSVEEGVKREKYFQQHIFNKYDIILTKHKDEFKHYDFTFTKNIKVELKTYNYSTNDLTDAFFGSDKVLYYYFRKCFNPNLRFFIVFAFYYVKDDKQYIKYLFEEFDIEKVRTYKKTVFLNKKHYCFPIKGLQPLKEMVSIIRQQ